MEDNKKISLEVNSLKVDKVRIFFEFAFKISKRLSLTQFFDFYKGDFADAEIDNASKEVLERFEKIKVYLSEKYKNDEHTLNLYLKQEEQICKTIIKQNNEYKINKGSIEFTPLQKKLYDLSITQEVSNSNHCTFGGGLKRNLFFNISKELKNFLNNYESLFQRDILEDPGFYKDKECKISICSHEEYCICYFTESEFKSFKKLEIPYNLID